MGLGKLACSKSSDCTDALSTPSTGNAFESRQPASDAPVAVAVPVVHQSPCLIGPPQSSLAVALCQAEESEGPAHGACTNNQQDCTSIQTQRKLVSIITKAISLLCHSTALRTVDRKTLWLFPLSRVNAATSTSYCRVAQHLCDAEKSIIVPSAVEVFACRRHAWNQRPIQSAPGSQSQLMTNSLRFSRRFSMAALRCRFRRHHITTIVPTTDGTPIATPTPMATGLLMPDPPSLGESTTVGCWRRDRVSLRRVHLFKKLPSSYWRTRPGRPWHARRLRYAEERRLCKQRNFSPGPAHRPQLELVQTPREPSERIWRPRPEVRCAAGAC